MKHNLRKIRERGVAQPFHHMNPSSIQNGAASPPNQPTHGTSRQPNRSTTDPVTKQAHGGVKLRNKWPVLGLFVMSHYWHCEVWIRIWNISIVLPLSCSFEESRLLVSWCGDGKCNMAGNDKDRDRSRRPDAVCGLHHARRDEEHRFLGWASKLKLTVCHWFGLKITEAVCQWFSLKTKITGTVFFDLTSKPVATILSGLTSKPVATISFSLTSKLMVCFLGWASKTRW
jgi:hypothetical protein